MNAGNNPYAQRRRRFSLIVFVALAISVYALFSGLEAKRQAELVSPNEPTQEEIESDDSLVLASEALGRLAVKDRVSRDGYSRDRFSSGWETVKGCDMRNRILQRDLEDIVLDDDGCKVLSGVLPNDPFTGERIEFTRGRTTSGAIHIEHLVAVSDAWQKGAQGLTYEQRHRFYNDPLNLIAVDGPANMAKGAADASGWLPVKEYRCRYIARQIAVKLKYLLWVTKAELNSMRQVLQTCPLQVLPIEEAVGVGD